MVKILSPSEMATKKWNDLTPEEKSAHLKKMQKGNVNRWARLTPEERSEAMKEVRAAKKKPKI